MISREEFGLIKSLLLKRGTMDVKIVSDSMYPLIKVDETIEIEPIKDKLHPGDIVVFYDRGVFNCHIFLKYLSEKSDTILSMGLNAKHVDLPVPAENILGLAKRIKKPFWYRFLLYYRIFKL